MTTELENANQAANLLEYWAQHMTVNSDDETPLRKGMFNFSTLIGFDCIRIVSPVVHDGLIARRGIATHRNDFDIDTVTYIGEQGKIIFEEMYPAKMVDQPYQYEKPLGGSHRL